MRKFLKYAFVGAIALTGFGLVSCSSDDDLDNSTTGLTGEAVKTAFTISFPENVVKTKQTAAIVQESPTIASFRGMENIVLIPFGEAGDKNYTNDDAPVKPTSKKIGGAITLNNITLPTSAATTTAGNTIPAGKLLENSNAVLFNDVTIPLGTSSFLFYGKAKDEGADKFVTGALDYTTTEVEPSDITFKPVKTRKTAATDYAGAIATYLSNIAQAQSTDATPVAWSATTNEGLKKLYDAFITLKAGSTRHIQAAVQDLYASIYTNTDNMSKGIKNAILDATYASDATTSGILTFTDATGDVTSDATCYPTNVNIPDGAALLTYNSSTKTFTQVTTGDGVDPISAANIENITGKFDDYVYPASLYYVSNSEIKTANASKKTEYDGVNDWATILGAYTDGTSVTASTRSVAIADQIQYAVGRLDTKVTAAEVLYDRNGEKVDGSSAGKNNAGSRFPITGVLIGGQKDVNYMFVPSGSTEYTIYDNTTTSNGGTYTYAIADSPATTYTLALETAENQKVMVAIEFLNNSGQDFQGYDGVVPEGGKFYLVAELDPTSTNTNAENQSNTGNRVFKQDFKTIANFTIAPGTLADPAAANHNTTGLGAAYNTIPDLRTPKLELGLSVNLQWQTGITFNHTF